MHPTIEWKDGKVVMIDQRRLPLRGNLPRVPDEDQVAEAIETMVIRGAPAIGVAAAYGVALGVAAAQAGAGRRGRDSSGSRPRLGGRGPTARNLFWALERMKAVFEANRGLAAGRPASSASSTKPRRSSARTRRSAARIGATRRRPSSTTATTVLTHCNAGGLATAGYGTAVGVIRAAWEAGKKIHVLADETRPFLQGARLTAWELDKLGIPYARHHRQHGRLADAQGRRCSSAVVGADRIARNGDTANKIGTYSVAVLCQGERRPVLRRRAAQHLRFHAWPTAA